MTVGVEWDDVIRGKHDGSCTDNKGIVHRYFNCRKGSGSFVKPNKVSGGRSFLEALFERYVSMDAPEIAPQEILPGAFVMTSKGSLKKIEFVGERKIRYLT